MSLDLRLQAGKILRFTYTDQHGDKTNRAAYVYGNHPNGDLDAYCFAREDRRRFHPRSIIGANVVQATIKAVPLSQLPGNGSGVNLAFKNEGFSTWTTDGTLYAVKQDEPSFEVGISGENFIVTVTNGEDSDAFCVNLRHGIMKAGKRLSPQELLTLLADVLIK